MANKPSKRSKRPQTKPSRRKMGRTAKPRRGRPIMTRLHGAGIPKAWKLLPEFRALMGFAT